jgi:hypothetical protein
MATQYELTVIKSLYFCRRMVPLLNFLVTINLHRLNYSALLLCKPLEYIFHLSMWCGLFFSYFVHAEKILKTTFIGLKEKISSFDNIHTDANRLLCNTIAVVIKNRPHLHID